jgi:hypothetical protein
VSAGDELGELTSNAPKNSTAQFLNLPCLGTAELHTAAMPKSARLPNRQNETNDDTHVG